MVRKGHSEPFQAFVELQFGPNHSVLLLDVRDVVATGEACGRGWRCFLENPQNIEYFWLRGLWVTMHP